MVFPLKFPLKSLIPHTPNDEERMAAEMIMKEAFEARLSAERHGVMGYLDSYRREPQTRGKPDSKFLQNVISHTLAHNKTVSTEPPWHRHHHTSSKYKERDKRRKRRSEDMHPRSEASSSSSRRSPKRSRREEVIEHEKEGNLDSSDRDGNFREPKHDGKDDVGEGSDEVEGGEEQDGKDNNAVGPTRSMLPPENRKVRGRGAFAYLMGNARMDALFAQPSDDEEEEAKKELARRCNSGAVASQMMMKKRELSTDEESSSSSGSSSEEERKRKRRKEKKKKKKERKKKKRKEEEKKKKKKRRKKEREDAKKQKLQT